MRNITAATKISEILNAYPELTDYLMDLRLCRSDAGPDSILEWELARAAAEQDLALQPLLEELHKRIRR